MIICFGLLGEMLGLCVESGRPDMTCEEWGQPCQVGGRGGPGEADVRPVWFFDLGPDESGWRCRINGDFLGTDSTVGHASPCSTLMSQVRRARSSFFE